MIQIRPVSDLRNKFPDIEKAANDLLDAVEKAKDYLLRNHLNHFAL